MDKPGIKTSEFYLSLIAVTGAVVLAMAGKVDGNAALAVVAAATVGYDVARGKAKSK